MDNFNLLNLIGTISVFISSLLAFFLLTVKSQNSLANRLFAAFLIVTAIDLSGFFLYRYVEFFPGLEVFRITISALNMPFFYLYILSACYSDFRLKPKHLWLAIPFALFNLVLIFRFYSASSTDKNLFLKNLDQMPEMICFHIWGEILYVIYIVAIFVALRKYREIYLENYANPNTLIYKWLFQISFVSLAAHSIVIIKDFLRYSEYADFFIWANVIVGMIVLTVLCWFVLKALYNPELFRGIDSQLPLIREIIFKPEANLEKTDFKNEQDPQITARITQLQKYMSENEPFLDPSLTIQELADKIAMPVRDLSILINHNMNLHFFDFINEYRIRKSVELLKDISKKDLTILEILYEVGFNSKSSFNTAFKKYTKLTPTEYRNISKAAR